MARASSPLPVPLSPVISTVARDARHLTRGAVDLLHGRTCTDEAFEPFAVALAELAPQVLGLDLQVAAFERTLDDEHERVEVDRLGEVVLGAGAHRRDRGAEIGESRRHDDRKLLVLLVQLVGGA